VLRPLRAAAPSAEVARRGHRRPEAEGLDALGHHVDDILGALDAPGDEEHRRVARHMAPAGPCAAREHHVHVAGLILQVQEHRAVGGLGCWRCVTTPATSTRAVELAAHSAADESTRAGRGRGGPAPWRSGPG